MPYVIIKAQGKFIKERRKQMKLSKKTALVTSLVCAMLISSAHKNLIAVKGAVPGAKGGIVFIRDSVKA